MERRTFIKKAALGAVGVATGLSGLTSRLALADSEPLKFALMTPMSGPGALYGQNSKNCATLAVEEINAKGGVLGRRLEMLIGDSGVSPSDSAQTALRMWKRDKVSALVSNSDSAVRTALENLFRGQMPHFYTPVYEGGDCAPGTFFLAETPAHQINPVIPWLSTQNKVKRWFLIGNDYIWPRKSNEVAKRVIQKSGGSVVGEEYVPFTVDNFDSTLAKIRDSGADAVFVTLVGGSSVTFNRSFANFGLSDKILRFGTLVDESVLNGIGAANSRNLYSSSGFFVDAQRPSIAEFVARYKKRFGSVDGLGAIGESAYDGVYMFKTVAERAKSISIHDMETASEGATFNGPRGPITMKSRNVTCDILLAKANGAKFDIVKNFDQLDSGETCRIS